MDLIKSVVFDRIAQLKGILTSDQDSILTIQAGFVGAWGK